LGQGTESRWIARRQTVSALQSRKQNWDRHFRWEHTILVGKTKTGVVTVQVLNINEPARVMLRENLLFEGRFPPQE
jgi:hypothetical protein